MRKIIGEGFISAILFLSGLFLLLSHIRTLTEKSNTIPFISSLMLFFVSLIFLLLTLKSLMKYIAQQKKDEEAVETVVVGSKSLIERNNEIVNDWDKTNEARDRLKLLKMAAAAGDEEK